MRELSTSPTEIIYDNDHDLLIFKMPKGLQKTRKKINKKGSDIHALHENSRGPRSTHIDPLLRTKIRDRLNAPSPREQQRREAQTSRNSKEEG